MKHVSCDETNPMFWFHPMKHVLNYYFVREQANKRLLCEAHISSHHG